MPMAIMKILLLYVLYALLRVFYVTGLHESQNYRNFIRFLYFFLPQQIVAFSKSSGFPMHLTKCMCGSENVMDLFGLKIQSDSPSYSTGFFLVLCYIVRIVVVMMVCSYDGRPSAAPCVMFFFLILQYAEFTMIGRETTTELRIGGNSWNGKELECFQQTY